MKLPKAKKASTKTLKQIAEIKRLDRKWAKEQLAKYGIKI